MQYYTHITFHNYQAIPNGLVTAGKYGAIIWNTLFPRSVLYEISIWKFEITTARNIEMHVVKLLFFNIKNDQLLSPT
jgi:hypothetical protein